MGLVVEGSGEIECAQEEAGKGEGPEDSDRRPLTGGDPPDVARPNLPLFFNAALIPGLEPAGVIELQGLGPA